MVKHVECVADCMERLICVYRELFARKKTKTISMRNANEQRISREKMPRKKLTTQLILYFVHIICVFYEIRASISIQ